MLRYVTHRIIQLIPVLFIMSLIVFSFIHLIPGEPVDYMLGFEATEEAKAMLRSELGLDRNIFIQYISWISRVLQGDLGKSILSHQPVLTTILEKFPATIALALAATFVSFFIALLIGTIAGANRGSYKDLSVLIIALVWVSIPTFWWGIILILIFAIYIPAFPSMGYVSLFTDFPEAIRHLVLPAVSLGAVMAGGVARLSRSEVIEQLGKDYITTAWAKGLSRTVVIYKHALKNALIPVFTFTGVQLGHLLGGAVVTEQIFNWPGVGRLAVQAIFARDYPMVQGIVLFVAVVFVLLNLVVDISYSLLNPQIRYEKKE